MGGCQKEWSLSPVCLPCLSFTGSGLASLVEDFFVGGFFFFCAESALDLMLGRSWNV